MNLLDSIAKELNVSKKYIQLVFRRAGTTPQKYLQHHRATFARTLLAGAPSSLSTEESESIATQAGFNSAAVMRRVIARELGSL